MVIVPAIQNPCVSAGGLDRAVVASLNHLNATGSIVKPNQLQ
jgi:hypothetical protein